MSSFDTFKNKFSTEYGKELNKIRDRIELVLQNAADRDLENELVALLIKDTANAPPKEELQKILVPFLREILESRDQVRRSETEAKRLAKQERDAEIEETAKRARRDDDNSSRKQEAAPRYEMGSAIRETIPVIKKYDDTRVIFDDDDLNGECFIVHGEGENLSPVAGTQVVFSEHIPRANENGKIRKVPFKTEHLRAFLLANTAYLKEADPKISFKDAATVAYLRYLSVTNGLISPDFNPAVSHVSYNDAIELSTEEYDALIDTDADIGVLTGSYRANIRDLFTDLVCCVAYMFRVRGHHYLDDMEVRYGRLFDRCLHPQSSLPLSWLHISRYALHAIFPSVLDDFWKYCKDNTFIAGTLAKRFDCAPAGSSGVLGLLKGVKDIQILIPTALTLSGKQVKLLEEMADKIKADRWCASVNARYYGATRLRIDEDQIGVLASIVLGIYERLAPASELRNAPSIKRLATLAPATGGAIGRIASNTVTDERMRIADAHDVNDNH